MRLLAPVLRATAALTLLALTAQTAPPTSVPASPSWLHAGSDIPADPDWRTGTLPNGVRYAVRRSATPPGTVAIRVRIDAGALMETDDQQGWAHLLEHMVFRGTANRKDGEAVKLWQRLGARFGSDSNAFTTLSATTYKLDLPRADEPSVHEAVGALADMMRSATIDTQPLDIERKVVMAEGAQRMTPLNKRISDTSRALFRAGLLAEKRDVIGTDATLTAATSERLRAFYHLWYRPERAVVVLAGDADPALLEDVIKASFGAWKADGAPSPEPAYGAPKAPPTTIALVSDPLASTGLTAGWIGPHEDRPYSIERQRNEFLTQIALSVVNQRLSDEALKGGPLLRGVVGRNRARHGSDDTLLLVSQRGSAWEGALDSAFAVINRSLAVPVTQAEIDQQTAGFGEGQRRMVTTSKTWPAAAYADMFISDVDSGDVAAPRSFYADLFDAQKASITPAAVQAALKTLFAPEPRLLVISPRPIDGGTAAVAAAFTKAQSIAGGEEVAVRAVSLDELPKPGSPGTEVDTRRFDDLGIERVRFANGVELTMKRTDFARDSIQVDVAVGRGLAGRARNDAGPTWSAAVLSASGIGPFTAPEFARVAAGRQIGIRVGSGLDGLTLSSATSPRDLADAFRVLTTEMTVPRFDQVALSRLRDSFAAGFRTIRGQPGSVFQAYGTAPIYGGDLRFRAMPDPREVQTMQLSAVRSYWSDALGAGPIRVRVVGDFDRDAVIKAVAATLGALPPRPAIPIDPARATIPPFANAPVTLTHDGDPNQAIAARAWRTQGGLIDLPVTRALTVTTAIIQNRLNEEFRENDAGSYSPFANAIEVRGFPDFGAVMVGAQLQPSRIADLDAALGRIITDLATNGPSDDALLRARQTVVGAAGRAKNDNGFWQSAVSRDLDDPRELESVRTYVSGRQAVDKAAVQAVVRRFLVGHPPLKIDVLPNPKRRAK